MNEAGLPECIVRSINACHPLLHPLLYESIILTGGTTKFPHFAERLYLTVRNVPSLGCQDELQKLFASYGEVEECKSMDAEDCEEFTGLTSPKLELLEVMASDAMLYFNSIGCSPLIAMNPAEFLIDLANGNINDKSIPSELESKNFVTDTKPSPIQVQEYLAGVCGERAAKLRAEEFLKPAIICSQLEMQMTVNTRERGATWCEQFLVLCSRGFKERRHEYFSMMRVMQVVATALIIGSLWWCCNSSSPRGLQDQGYCFSSQCSGAFFPLFTAVFTFPQERAMLNKERSVGLYKLSAYFAAGNMTDVPLDLILPILFMLIVYFMVGLKLTFPAFSLTMLTVFFSITAAQGLRLSIGATFMDVKKAMTLASVILMTSVLSGGFFIQVDINSRNRLRILQQDILFSVLNLVRCKSMDAEASNFGILAAVPEIEHDRNQIRQNLSSARMIPLERTLSSSFRHQQYQSAPMNVPLRMRNDFEEAEMFKARDLGQEVDPSLENDDLPGADGSDSFVSELANAIPGIDEAMSFAEMLKKSKGAKLLTCLMDIVGPTRLDLLSKVFGLTRLVFARYSCYVICLKEDHDNYSGKAKKLANMEKILLTGLHSTTNHFMTTSLLRSTANHFKEKFEVETHAMRSLHALKN